MDDEARTFLRTSVVGWEGHPTVPYEEEPTPFGSAVFMVDRVYFSAEDGSPLLTSGPLLPGEAFGPDILRRQKVVPFRDIRVGDLVEDMNGVPYEVMKIEWTDRTTPLLLRPLDQLSPPRWDYSLNAPFILVSRP